MATTEDDIKKLKYGNSAIPTNTAPVKTATPPIAFGDYTKPGKEDRGSAMQDISYKPKPENPSALPWPGDFDYSTVNPEGAPMGPMGTPRQATADKATAGAADVTKPTPGTKPVSKTAPKSVSSPIQKPMGDTTVQPFLSTDRFGNPKITNMAADKPAKSIAPAQALPKGDFENVGDGTKQFMGPSPLASMQGTGTGEGGKGQVMQAFPSDAASQQLVADRKSETDRYFQNRYGVNLGSLRRKLMESLVNQHQAQADYYNKRATGPAPTFRMKMLEQRASQLGKVIDDPMRTDDERTGAEEALQKIYQTMEQHETAQSGQPFAGGPSIPKEGETKTLSDGNTKAVFKNGKWEKSST